MIFLIAESWGYPLDVLSSEYIQLQRRRKTSNVICQHLDVGGHGSTRTSGDMALVWQRYELEIGHFRILTIVPSGRSTNEHFSNTIETQRSILEYRTADNPSVYKQANQDEARLRSFADLWDADAPSAATCEDFRPQSLPPNRMCQTRLRTFSRGSQTGCFSDILLGSAHASYTSYSRSFPCRVMSTG